jgi:glycosyltransferase involved in cell wall biosynthesis
MGVMIAERLCPKGKVKVLLGGSINGVDAQQRFNPDLVDFQRRIEICRALGIPESALVIGFVGRIVVDKGVVELVKACESLLDDYPSFHLLMVGPFESRDSVPPSIENILRTHPNIHCTGMDWNTPPLYSAMDVVVLPSYREGFPSVPLEAGAMRLPVVATTVPGCVDAVIDGVTGILVPPRDCEALADAVKKYLNSPDLRLRHGRAGRERVLREFGQEDIWKAIHAEYQRLLSVGES